MRNHLVLVALLIPLLAGPVRAQVPIVYITGSVVDAETGDPLPGAHVFIATSQIGTVTDSAGRYRLEGVPVGAGRLYVSMLGFEPEGRNIIFRAGDVYHYTFELEPAVLEAGEIVVEAKRDRNWKQRLERFTRQFVGETPFAREAKILNPEVLDFSDHIGRLTARASAPLEIENRALGYRIQYFLKDFEATSQRTKYDGEPLYAELTPENDAERDRWRRARISAFSGSFRHLMLAMLGDRVTPQGFKLYSRPAMGNGVEGNAGPLQSGQRFPIDAPASLLGPGASPEERIFSFTGFVEVVFLGETETEAYLEWRQGHSRSRPGYQTSWLRLEHGPTVVDYKGDVLDPYGVTFFGYLAFERVGDQLPREYRPGQ